MLGNSLKARATRIKTKKMNHSSDPTERRKRCPPDRPVPVPRRDLWRLASDGALSEENVDAHGCVRDSDLFTLRHSMSLSLIRRYEAALQIMCEKEEKEEHSNLTFSVHCGGSAPSSSSRNVDVDREGTPPPRQLWDELHERISVVEMEITNILHALSRAGVWVRHDPYSE